MVKKRNGGWVLTPKKGFGILLLIVGMYFSFSASFVFFMFPAGFSYSDIETGVVAAFLIGIISILVGIFFLYDFKLSFKN